MGSDQSSTRGAGQPTATPQKTCYYELLHVDPVATEDE